MRDKGGRVRLDIRTICTKEPCLNRMEARRCVRPSIDFLVKVGSKSRRERFEPLPAGTGGNPGLLGALEISCPHALLERPRLGQGPADTLEEVRSVLLGDLIKRRRLGTRRSVNGRQEANCRGEEPQNFGAKLPFHSGCIAFGRLHFPRGCTTPGRDKASHADSQLRCSLSLK